ncbi:MAG: DUF5719 family protein [Actinomycetota bacterium]|nr:DUF5719 family protein [Actinomycetota bacterium]
MVAVLGAGLLVGVLAGGPGAPRAASPPGVAASAVSVVAPADAVSSAWYCAGATDVRSGAASGRLLLVDSGGRAVRAAVRIVSDAGRSRSLAVVVAARSSATLPETVPGGAAWVGAEVTFDGGSASVEQETSGPLGATLQPCATAVSPSWYFASGETLVNATTTIILLDPGAAPAIVDLSFTTDEGREVPSELQGLVVPAGGMVVVPLRSRLRRRSYIATTVSTSSGSVVAWEVEAVARPAKGAVILGTKAALAPLADPASPFEGVVEVPGAPGASTRWWWPDGGTARGTSEVYRIYDPGARTARVSLSVALDEGSAEPFLLTVGPGQVATLPTSASARIPAGVPYGAFLHSLNGVPVVAERTLVASYPSSERGSVGVVGATLPATQWLLGAPRVGGDRLVGIAVAAVSGGRTAVRLDSLVSGSLVPVRGLGPLELSGDAPFVVDLAHLPEPLPGPLALVASHPVVASVQLADPGRAGGLTESLGTPVLPRG